MRKNAECLLGNSIVWQLDPDKNKLGPFYNRKFSALRVKDTLQEVIKRPSLYLPPKWPNAKKNTPKLSVQSNIVLLLKSLKQRESNFANTLILLLLLIAREPLIPIQAIACFVYLTVRAKYEVGSSAQFKLIMPFILGWFFHSLLELLL